MQLFISWSGDRSKALAACLRDWLPLVIQSITPWFSPEDIDKGARWLSELSLQLEKQSLAVVCVTPENVNAPWLLFEVGALSKALEASWVCPVLLGIEPTDLQGPLAQFQATRTTQSDIHKLLLTINKRVSAPLPDSKLEMLFELLWPKLDAELETIKVLQKSSPSSHRPTNDILGEVLERVRGLERHVVDIKTEQNQRIEASLMEMVSRDPARQNIQERVDRLRIKSDHVTIEIANLDALIAENASTNGGNQNELLAKREALHSILRKLKQDTRQAEHTLDRLAFRGK